MTLKEEFKKLVDEATDKIREEHARKDEEDMRMILELRKRQEALMAMLSKNNPNSASQMQSHFPYKDENLK